MEINYIYRAYLSYGFNSEMLESHVMKSSSVGARKNVKKTGVSVLKHNFSTQPFAIVVKYASKLILLY